MSIVNELKRRNVLRVAAAYLVLSWLLMQIGDVLFETLELPATWDKGLLAMLILGAIPVLIFSWIYELTPDGLQKETEIGDGESVTAHTAKRLDIAVIVLLLLAAGLYGYGQFSGQQQAVIQEMSEAPRPTEEVSSDERELPPVVAVLPFKATGSDDGGELASGLHDDLLTRLAKLGAFRVISRTSMMEYAETAKNMRQIGEELGAGFILEGGVQARGSRIRINAQLIDTLSDEHLWAEIYDRELTAADLFDIQAELALAIATELKITLSPADQEVTQTIPTQNIDAYKAYLRSLKRMGSRGWVGERDLDIVEDLREAVSLDPSFALAWAKLADALIGYSVAEPDAAEDALIAISKARILSPHLLEAELAWVHYVYRVLNEYDQALKALDALGDRIAGNYRAIMLRSFLARRLGRFQEAYDLGRAAHRLDPRDPMTTVRVAHYALHLDDCETAMSYTEKALELDGAIHDVRSTAANIVLNCAGDAVRADRLLRDADFGTDPGRQFAYDAAQHLGDAARLRELNNLFLSSAPPGTLAEGFARLEKMHLDQYQGLDDEFRDELQQIGELRETLAKDEQVAATSGFAAFSAWHSASTGDADATRRWIEEVRKRTRDELKGDVFVESDNRMFLAGALAVAGLHDEAIAKLEVMLSQPGGYRFPYLDGLPFGKLLGGNPGYEALRERFDTRVGG